MSPTFKGWGRTPGKSRNHFNGFPQLAFLDILLSKHRVLH
jgi:hypothetical protein